MHNFFYYTKKNSQVGEFLSACMSQNDDKFEQKLDKYFYEWVLSDYILV